VLAKADLRGSDLSALDPRSCDVAGAIIDAEQAVMLALALGFTIA
jgi:fluoroquinolone resistance protein